MIQIGLWNYSFINETNEKMTEWVDDDVSLSICRYSTSFVHIAYVVFYFYLILSPFKLSPVSEMPSKMPTNSKMRMPCHFFISVTNKKLIPETNLNHLLLSHFLNLKGQVKHFHFSNLQTKFQRAFLFPKMCTLLIGWTLGAPLWERKSCCVGYHCNTKYIHTVAQTSCTTAATLRAPCWRKSASSSNRRAVRQPHPLGAFGRRVPVCLKLPNTITSLFDGHINWIIEPNCEGVLNQMLQYTIVQIVGNYSAQPVRTWYLAVTFSRESTNIWTWKINCQLRMSVGIA